MDGGTGGRGGKRERESEDFSQVREEIEKGLHHQPVVEVFQRACDNNGARQVARPGGLRVVSRKTGGSLAGGNVVKGPKEQP